MPSYPRADAPDPDNPHPQGSAQATIILGQPAWRDDASDWDSFAHWLALVDAGAFKPVEMAKDVARR